MKKAIVFTLAAALLLALAAPAGAQEQGLETGIVQGNNIPAILRFLPRGEMVAVTGELDGTFSSIETQEGSGMMETQLLRLEDEEPYEPWTGYANSAGIYPSYELDGKPLQTLNTNTRLEVLDELEECYIVPYEQKETAQDGTETVIWHTAFVPKEQLSSSPIRYSSEGSAEPQDGGDIIMQAGWSLHRLSQVSITRDAQVKADGAKLILRHYQAGETVQIVSDGPELAGYVTILVDGQYAYLPEAWVLREGQESPEARQVYAGYRCGLYADYALRGEPLEQLKVNTKLTILWETENSCFVQAGELTGFIPAGSFQSAPLSPGSSSSAEGGTWTPPLL